MSVWRDWKRLAAPGCLLGSAFTLMVWPESVRHDLFFWAVGTALMLAFAHRNGRFLPSRPVMAWIVVLGVVPSPFVAATYVLTTSASLPFQDSAFQLIMICLSTVAAASVLGFVERKMGGDSRLARFLRAIEPS